MKKPNIQIVEVGPRDGLQNEKTIIPTAIKLAFIHKLIASGLRTIEATSFVPAKSIPQMADHEQLITQLLKNSQVRFPVLVPNQTGLANALRCKVKNIAVFASASETFSQKNLHRSISESLKEYGMVTQEALRHGISVRGYVSCTLGCPYEGKVPLAQVLKVATALYDAGCTEIALGDTIGVGTPKAASSMLKTVASEIPIANLAIHFHDTYGQALANILACLDVGVQTIDSSVAGLGGCPYAKGASGNVATEEVIYMLEGLGLHTGVDLSALIQAAEFICAHLDHGNRSKVAIALLAKKSNH